MISARDKVLPTQPYFAEHWRGRDDYADAVADLVTAFSKHAIPKFNLLAPAEAPLEKFSSTPAMLSLLIGLVQWTGAKNILEIGTFAGVASLHLAKASSGRVTSIEACAEFVLVARSNALRNDLDQHIRIIEGDAREVLDNLSPGFDFVFIDGCKQAYAELAQKAEALLAERAMMVIDDVFFHGDALNDKRLTSKGQGARDVLDHYRNGTAFKSLLLPVSNGVMVLWRG